MSRSPLGPYMLMPYRFWFAFSYFWPSLARIPGWVLRSRELSNFTYAVTDRSNDCAAHMVALVANLDWETTRGYISEFYGGADGLDQHVRRCTAQSEDRFVSDANALPGHRLVYYALARALKPKLIIEAGVHRGFGTCILSEALYKNEKEGFPGALIGLDLNPSSGYLIQPPYGQHAQLIVGDVLHYLERDLNHPVDFYIHDTVNDPAIETREYELVEPHLSERALVAGAWHTHALMKFARRTGRHYIAFHEEPLNSWFPGSTIGVASKP